MVTLLLAWINAKYKAEYELLFLGTFLIDMTIVEAVYTYCN